MYTQPRPSQRIDQRVAIRQAELYEPLRRSLLRRNMSQSNISSRTNLQMSRANDLTASRVSRRMRSLSPEELDQIVIFSLSQKSTTFVPISKRLVPTRNLDVVRDKRFEAIDVEQRIHKPIPAIQFNSINRFNVNKVEEIVYQPQDQLYAAHFQRIHQPQPYSNNFQNDLRRPVVITSQNNIYTTRNHNVTPTYNNNFDVGVSEVREYFPRDSLPQSSNNLTETFGIKKINTNVPQKHYTTVESHYGHSAKNIPAPQVSAFQRISNNVTSFENSPAFNPSTLPIITSTGIHNDSTNSQHAQLPLNLYTSQCEQQVRELPTEHTLSFVASPFGSRTSFEPEIQKPQSSLSGKSYDFSKITQDSSSSEYKQKKQEEFKYNLFSIFDEPVNTKCAKTGCFKNEIIASRPNIYEWQQ